MISEDVPSSFMAGFNKTILSDAKISIILGYRSLALPRDEVIISSIGGRSQYDKLKIKHH